MADILHTNSFASIRRKHSARVAAIQCLYQIGIHGMPQDLGDYIENFARELERSIKEGDRDRALPIAPQRSLFTSIVHGVCVKKPELEARIRDSLKAGWKLERLSAVMVALLEAALWELNYSVAKPAVVVDEYVTLAREFLDEPEAGFINALLDGIVKQK